MIDINLSSGHKLLEECRPMYEYSWFIQQIKDYLHEGWTRDAAIAQAVNDCMEEGILAEFMKNHGSEVANMLYTQWDYDEAVSVEREEAYEDGREAGKAEGLMESDRQAIYIFLERLGTIPEDIHRRIEAEQDRATLQKWHIAAPSVKSFEEFRESMNTANK